MSKSKATVGPDSIYSKPPEGSWGRRYPDLGNDPLTFEDSISPEFFELERQALFRRLWLKVGRVEEVPNVGSYFTKEIPVCNTSIVVVRGKDQRIRAFHNVCSHRGNKLVWDQHPGREVRGTCVQFRCKYHAWRYALDGTLVHVTNEEDFCEVDRRKYSLPAVHLDVWEGFIFVNFAEQPEQTLREFLGDLILSIEGYPFHKLTHVYSFTAEVNSNWKLFIDSFQESYHGPYLHARVFGGLAAMPDNIGAGLIDVRFDGPHRLFSTPGAPTDESLATPTERLFKGSLWGPWKKADIGIPTVADLPRGVNAMRNPKWGCDSFQLFPNGTILIWEGSWVICYGWWPITVDKHLFEMQMYFTPPKTVRERLAQEMTVITVREALLQDANTLEATHSMLKARARRDYMICDEEILIRHLHQTVQDYVRSYQRQVAGMELPAAHS